MKEKLKQLFGLFGAFAVVGVTTFGGGYAMLPALQREVVEKRRRWACGGRGRGRGTPSASARRASSRSTPPRSSGRSRRASGAASLPRWASCSRRSSSS
ncbi:MAG: chromate transporter [Oscillospiraceae bacterium]